MCVICVSDSGIAQPTEAVMARMFESNPHGAGYMTARNGRVEIAKGFLTWEDFIHAVRYEHFTAADPVVYHFRISTQAGTGAAMTHPFPLTNSIEQCKMLDVSCPIGVAHNGVIQLTSDPREKEYSDTAHYIAEFLCHLVRAPEDLHNPSILSAIQRTTHSKWALMDGGGYIATVGDFIEDGGLLYSNASYRPASHRSRLQISTAPRNFFEDEAFAY